MNKRILIITQYFYPELFRINDIAVELVKRGYDITVLTGVPNYPLGDIYDGYKREYREDIYEGVKIVRIPSYPRGHSKLTLLKFCLSFVKFGKKWIDDIAFKNNGRLPFDVIFTSEVSPMTQALIGCYAGKKYGVKSILHVQDLWPENVIEIMGIKNPFIIKPIENMVRKIYRDTDLILGTSKSFVEAIRKRAPKDKDIKYWPQYAEDFYKPLPKVPHDDFRIVFTGNVGYAQGLDILPRTALKLKEKNVKVKFVIVGDGRYKQELIKEIADKNVTEYFEMIDKKPPEEIPKILASCDVAFVSFANKEIFKMTIPAKLQSYMACGMPILGYADGETKRIIEDAKCGVCVKQGDEEGLVSAIINFIKCDIKMMGEEANRYQEDSFNRDKLINEIESILSLSNYSRRDYGN